MTPAARLSAAIEVLDAIRVGRGRADAALKAWAKPRRFAGSGDRRAIAERVYTALRLRGRIAARMGSDDGRALVLGSLAEADGLDLAAVESLFTGEGHAPPPLADHERDRLARPPEGHPATLTGAPDFVVQALIHRWGEAEGLAEAQALIGDRAPVDLRVNTLRGDVAAARRLLAAEGIEPEPAPLSALGLRLPAAFAADIQATRAFKTGWVEVQDEASQVAAALSGVRPGQTVIDWCAGGGGKTLALAALLHGSGRLVALDVDAKRLAALEPRLERAGAAAEVRKLAGDYLERGGAPDDLPLADVVFVDAPCSGTGAWRRHPEAAWRLGAATVDRLIMLQRSILREAARKVRPGGRLLYATCSILPAENDANAADFAAQHEGFAPLPIAAAAAGAPGLTAGASERLAALASPPHTLQMSPRRTGTDGFFIALFERTA